MPFALSSARIAPIILGFFLIIGSARAQTVDFDSDIYGAGKSFLNVDGWTQLGKVNVLNPGDFTIQDTVGNKWAHVQTSLAGSMYRTFSNNTGLTDLRWRWRASGDLVQLCVGASRTSSIDEFYPLALVCIEPSGVFETKGSKAILVTKEVWTRQKWYYMRMVVDASKSSFTVYIANDSLRTDERSMVASTSTNDSAGVVSQVVIKCQNGAGYVDVDDISFEALATWAATGPDTNWTSAANWSTKAVPDASTHVVFDGSSAKGCFLNGHAAVGNLQVSPSYNGVFNIGASVLTLTKNGDFSGGANVAYAAGGELAFSSPSSEPQSLSGPANGHNLPPIAHMGPGTLRISDRPLYADGLSQTGGQFDFNGYDVNVSGNLIVKNGLPGTLINLGGRTITVGKSAHLEGVSASALLGLDPASPAGWTIFAAAADSLKASYALLGDARATGFPGLAEQCLDAGGNTGWTFSTSPVNAPPADSSKGDLQPGQRMDVQPGYTVSAVDKAAADVIVEVLGAGSAAGLRGFRDVQFMIRLSPKDGSAPFPGAVLSAPASDPRSLYMVASGGKAKFITSDRIVTLSGPGTYFFGTDTLAPRITPLGESFVSDDSTLARFLIEDNTSDLLLDLVRSDSVRLGFSGKAIGSGETLSVVMKSPSAFFGPLGLRLTAADHANVSSFPSEGSWHFLAQKIAAASRTPDAFHIGLRAADPWDLIALPLAAVPPMTLAVLRHANPKENLQADIWNEKQGSYRSMQDTEAFLPGSSVWIASKAGKRTSLRLPALQTVPRPQDGPWALALHAGWNQVSNPTLGTLYWPISRSASPNYDMSPVKAPYGYDPAAEAYVRTDSLEPWRGYFVYNKGGDTTVLLRPRPLAAKSAAKIAAFAGISFDLGLAGASLRLGALAKAADGIGIEDEPSPSSPSINAGEFFSVRQSRNLGTDIVQWKPGSVCAWRVVASLPAASGAEGASEGSSAANVRVQSLDLPGDYAVWAVSRFRGIRMRLDAQAGFPLSPGFTDTLEILAGPEAELETRLAPIPTSIAGFEAKVDAALGGFHLDLKLPRAYRIAWSLWSMDGRSLDAGSLYLPMGRYRLDRTRLRSGGSASGNYVLRLDWIAPGEAAGNRAVFRFQNRGG